MLAVVDDARVAACAGVLGGPGHQTIVLDDRLIKLAGGEPATSLSKGGGLCPRYAVRERLAISDPTMERYLIADEDVGHDRRRILQSVMKPFWEMSRSRHL
jgi:hypothetical protein